MSRQARETADIAALAVNEPRKVPGALLDKLRRAFRVVWSARGGGLYATGFFLTFIWLEVTTFFREILSADSVGSFFTEQFWEFLIRFTVQSIGNTIEAFLWPVRILQWSPEKGIVLLVGMYLVFAYVIKAPLERWLFHDVDDDRAIEEAGDATGK